MAGNVQTSCMSMLGLPSVQTTVCPTFVCLCRNCLSRGAQINRTSWKQIVISKLRSRREKSFGPYEDQTTTKIPMLELTAVSMILYSSSVRYSGQSNDWCYCYVRCCSLLALGLLLCMLLQPQAF